MGPPCSRERMTSSNFAVCFASWARPALESGRLVAAVAGEGVGLLSSPVGSDFYSCRCTGAPAFLDCRRARSCLGDISAIGARRACVGDEGP